jgi:hypothetical protein
LTKWLPKVIQSLDPFMSDGIPSGSPGIIEILGGLKDADFGVICVDSSNQESRWLNFEAGALGGKFGKRVAPYLLNLGKTDLLSPLSTFQADLADEAGTLHLIESINTFDTSVLVRPDVVKATFEKFWPDLNDQLNQIRDASPVEDVKRTQDDVLSEILDLVRGVNRAVASGALTPFVFSRPLYGPSGPSGPSGPTGASVTYSVAGTTGPTGPSAPMDLVLQSYDPSKLYLFETGPNAASVTVPNPAPAEESAAAHTIQQIQQLLGYDSVLSAVELSKDVVEVNLGRSLTVDEKNALQLLATERNVLIESVDGATGERLQSIPT